jgi:hypothetical protein
MQFRPRPNQASVNRQTYIPPSVQQSLNQQLQRTAPAHLKKYVGTGAYVPRHAQKALAEHMQKNAPGHLKQYADAYVQQNVVDLSLSPPKPVSTDPLNRAPSPNQMRRDHSNVPGSQYEVESNNLFAANPPNSQTAAPTQPNNQNPSDPNHPYEFILNPQQPAPRLGLLGGDRKIIRTGFIVGGVLLLLIILSLLKGALTSGPNFQPFVSVVQDQQELTHIMSGAVQQQDLSTVNQNFAYTAQASLSSSRIDMIDYLAKNKLKVSQKTLNLKVSPATDQKLTDALASATYNQTFHDISQAQLNAYINHLSAAYNLTTGPRGRALLRDDYSQAQLLLKLLNAPAT